MRLAAVLLAFAVLVRMAPKPVLVNRCSTFVTRIHYLILGALACAASYRTARDLFGALPHGYLIHLPRLHPSSCCRTSSSLWLLWRLTTTVSHRAEGRGLQTLRTPPKVRRAAAVAMAQRLGSGLGDSPLTRRTTRWSLISLWLRSWRMHCTAPTRWVLDRILAQACQP